MMKSFFSRLVSWWYATMVPVHTPPTTLEEGETLRKRRLFSIGMLFALVGEMLFLLAGLGSGAQVIQVVFNLLGCSLIALSLWINRRGHLKTANLFFFLFESVIMITFINMFSSLIPAFALFIWVMLLLLPMGAGLFLPAWGPGLLAAINIAFISWFVLDGYHRQIASYLPQPYAQFQLLCFSYLMFALIAIFSTLYAITTKKAVIQADRATELEQAHQTISEAYEKLEAAHATIQRQALTDPLTELPNHRALVDQLQRELAQARRSQQSFSLLFLDADHFKRVNDTYGHSTGDSVLRQIGTCTHTVLRAGDTLGRFGGEEFVALLPDTSVEEAVRVAERVRASIAASSVPVSGVEGGIAMTASIGLACYPEDASGEQELLVQADEAMYIAKRLGRNQVRTAEEARKLKTDSALMAHLKQDEQRETNLRYDKAS